MAKSPGQGSLWVKIKSIKEFKEAYIKEIIENVEESLKIKKDQLYNGGANLKASAANFYLAEYAKLEKEYRNTRPKDLVEHTDYEINKRREANRKKRAKQQGNGLIKLTFDEESENKDTGTD